MAKRPPLVTLLFTSLLCCLLLLSLSTWVQQNGQQDNTQNPLDGCRHVYLDMGSNIGVQVRKLYEPHLFPGAVVLRIFDRYFGPPSTRSPGTVCAVGWEPNSAHTPALLEIQETYRRCGWRTTFHTETGVGKDSVAVKYAAVDFIKYGAVDLYWANQIAGRMAGEGDHGLPTDKYGYTLSSRPVPVVRLADYINQVVATRRLPPDTAGSLPPSVVIKLDVEGREVGITVDLVMSGALRHVDQIHVDWPQDDDMDKDTVLKMAHALTFLSGVAEQQNLTHVTRISGEDDESYNDFSGKLPEC